MTAALIVVALVVVVLVLSAFATDGGQAMSDLHARLVRSGRGP